jgi:hypothetical protein
MKRLGVEGKCGAFQVKSKKVKGKIARNLFMVWGL